MNYIISILFSKIVAKINKLNLLFLEFQLTDNFIELIIKLFQFYTS